MGKVVIGLRSQHPSKNIQSLIITLGFQIGLAQQAVYSHGFGVLLQDVTTMRHSLVQVALMDKFIDVPQVGPQGNLRHIRYSQKTCE